MQMILCPYCMQRHESSVEICPEKEEKISQTYLEEAIHTPVVVMLTIGYSKHGKTCFLSSLLDTLDGNEIARQWDAFSTSCLTQKTRQKINKIYISPLHQGKLPDSTTVMFPEPLILKLHNVPQRVESLVGGRTREQRDVICIFYDIGGESFATVDGKEIDFNANMRKYTPVLRETNTLIFLISLPYLREETEKYGGSVTQRLKTLLDSVYIALRDMGKKKEKNLLICFTMADKMWGRQEEYDILAVGKDGRIPDLENFLTYWDDLEDYSERIGKYVQKTHPAFYNLLLKNFNRVRFSSISALGNEPEDGSFLLDPSHIIDPILWMLELDGYVEQQYSHQNPSHSSQRGKSFEQISASSVEKHQKEIPKRSDQPQQQVSSKSRVWGASEKTSDTILAAQHFYTREDAGLTTAAMTEGVISNQKRILEEHSLYALPPLFHDNPDTPEKYVFYPLAEEFVVVGKAVYKGKSMGRHGNYLSHNLIIPSKSIMKFYGNPATFIKWLNKRQVFRHKAPSQKELPALEFLPEKIEVPPYGVQGIEKRLAFLLLYYCLYAKSTRSPLVLIGTSEKCLNFLEWLYSLLPFSLRKSLAFDTYCYDSRIDYHIVCLPPKQEFQQTFPCSLKLHLTTLEYSVNFDVTEPTEQIDFIIDLVFSRKGNELSSLYHLENSLIDGDYSGFKEGYSKMSQEAQNFLLTPHRNTIFQHVAKHDDTEFLTEIQHNINSIEDLLLFSSSVAILQKIVSNDEDKVIELIEAWVDSNEESGLRQLQKSEEKQLAQGLYQAFGSLPESEREDTKLLRWSIQHELQYHESLLRQILEHDLSQLSAERQQRFIRSLVYDVTRIETSEQQETQINVILEQMFRNSSTKSPFFMLLSALQRLDLRNLSDRTTWIIENGTEEKVAEVERLWALERCSKEDRYVDFKTQYTAVAPKIQEIFLSSHKTELLSRIVQHKDIEFLKTIQDMTLSIDDIAILAQSADMLRKLLTQNEEHYAPLVAEWLLSQEKATEMYPLLFEFPALWRAFFQTLRSQPQRIRVLLVPLRFLQKEYRQDYENMLLEEMPDLIPHIKTEQGLTDEVFTALTNFPDSCPEQQQMLRALMAYNLSEAPYLLEELLHHNLFEMDGRYHTFILDALMKGILHAGTSEKREHALERVFTLAGTHQARLFTVSKAVEKHGLKSVSPRIALLTDMAAKGDVGGLNTFYALEHSIAQQDFKRFEAEYSRVTPAIQECILSSHKKTLLHYLAAHSDHELLRILQNAITEVDDIAILSRSSDMLKALMTAQGKRVTDMFLEHLFAQTDRQSFYPMLFTIPKLWKAFLQRVSTQSRHLDIFIEALRIFPEHYSETFEDILIEDMIFKILPVIKQQRKSESVLQAFDRRLPPVRNDRRNILRRFVVYDLKPRYAGFTELTDSNLALLPDEVQSVVLDSIMRNGIMKLKEKADIERHLKRLFKMASGDAEFLLQLISVIQNSKLSERDGKIFRNTLSEILERHIPNNRNFTQGRQQMTKLIHSLPEPSFWDWFFGW